MRIKRDYQFFTGKNIFFHLTERVIRKLHLSKCDYDYYKPRIYTILEKKLYAISLEELERLLEDLITFVKRWESAFTKRLTHGFIDVCVNAISYWIFAWKEDLSLAELVLRKTKPYLQDRRCTLAFVRRSFSPLFRSNKLLISPLLYMARSRKASVFKLLLQYGILEQETSPGGVVLEILFHPSRVRFTEDYILIDLYEEAKICLQLCNRVLPSMPVSDIEREIQYERSAIIPNWQEYIPISRYQEPCELRHLCRISIRRRLIAQNNLPDGLFSLPIPIPLKHYLNLDG
ncbi:ankyrin repeat and SOCS box protein 17 [Rhinoderma darwinii]|uniref:ankyrin repeat and SOCS box protein 17 n=1 Tax=Rhinoderma darwinii TaxID=43563 RepID=UPI003F67A85B